MPRGVQVQVLSSASNPGTKVPGFFADGVNILASGNLNSGNVETGVPEHGNRLDWLNGYLSGTTHLSSPEPLCGAKQALRLS